MTADANKLSCAEFQAQLPELIGTGEDIYSHPHLQTCEVCPALLADLETIAEAARQLLAVTDPPDTLWDNIVAAIESDSVPSTEKESLDLPGAAGLSVEPA